MLIVGVLEATFYRYQKYPKDQQEAKDHNNSGLLKPRKHIELAALTLKCILDKEVDHKSRKTKMLKSRVKVVSKILPVTFQWKNQISKINEANAAFGLKGVSISNLNKIRFIKFLEFNVKKPRDNFTWCGTCDKL